MFLRNRSWRMLTRLLVSHADGQRCLSSGMSSQAEQTRLSKGLCWVCDQDLAAWHRAVGSSCVFLLVVGGKCDDGKRHRFLVLLVQWERRTVGCRETKDEHAGVHLRPHKSHPYSYREKGKINRKPCSTTTVSQL